MQYLTDVKETKFQGGYESSRALNSRVLRTYDVTYRALSRTDYGTLSAFYEARLGGSDVFTMADPIDGGSSSWRFVNNSWSSYPISNAKFFVSFSIKEV